MLQKLWPCVSWYSKRNTSEEAAGSGKFSGHRFLSESCCLLKYSLASSGPKTRLLMKNSNGCEMTATANLLIRLWKKTSLIVLLQTILLLLCSVCIFFQMMYKVKVPLGFSGLSFLMLHELALRQEGKRGVASLPHGMLPLLCILFNFPSCN